MNSICRNFKILFITQLDTADTVEKKEEIQEIKNAVEGALVCTFLL